MSIFLGFIAHTLQINHEKVVKDIEIYGLKVGWKIPEWWKYFDLILLPLTWCKMDLHLSQDLAFLPLWPAVE